MKIIVIDNHKKVDRSKFIDLTYSLARDHVNWTPGLRLIDDDLINPSKNPFLQKNNSVFFIVRQNNKTVGRCALFEPGYWPGKPNTSHFGFVDFIDSKEVSGALFNQLKLFAKQKSVNHLIGPLNPNINYSVGVMNRGFDFPNKILMNYNPKYYLTHYKENGFNELKSFSAWDIPKENNIYHKRFRNALIRISENDKIIIRDVDLKNYDYELKIFFKLYNACFENHWGFVAPSWDEFKFIAGDLKWIIKPKLAIIAEYGRLPVGFVLSVPDYNELLYNNKSGKLLPFHWLHIIQNRNKINYTRIMIAGVLPEYRNTGIHLALFEKIATNIISSGYNGGEISWVLDGNSTLEKSIKMMGAKPVKEFKLMEYKF